MFIICRTRYPEVRGTKALPLPKEGLRMTEYVIDNSSLLLFSFLPPNHHHHVLVHIFVSRNEQS